MSNTTVVKANGANHIVSAAEAGMERWREKFAPERPLDACCHTCGGGLATRLCAPSPGGPSGASDLAAYRAVSCSIRIVAAALRRVAAAPQRRGGLLPRRLVVKIGREIVENFTAFPRLQRVHAVFFNHVIEGLRARRCCATSMVEWQALQLSKVTSRPTPGRSPP